MDEKLYGALQMKNNAKIKTFFATTILVYYDTFSYS